MGDSPRSSDAAAVPESPGGGGGGGSTGDRMRRKRKGKASMDGSGASAGTGKEGGSRRGGTKRPAGKARDGGSRGSRGSKGSKGSRKRRGGDSTGTASGTESGGGGSSSGAASNALALDLDDVRPILVTATEQPTSSVHDQYLASVSGTDGGGSTGGGDRATAGDVAGDGAGEEGAQANNAADAPKTDLPTLVATSPTGEVSEQGSIGGSGGGGGGEEGVALRYIPGGIKRASFESGRRRKSMQPKQASSPSMAVTPAVLEELNKVDRRATGGAWKPGVEITEEHHNYYLMFDMLTGIRYTVGKASAVPDRELVKADYADTTKLSFSCDPNNSSQGTPLMRGEGRRYDFKFKDYAKFVFRHIREHFQIDAADYMVSLTGDYVLSELGSPGKSKSFFYFSRDYRFIMKTISQSEAKFLIKTLPAYVQHIKNNRHTLISRFLGLHRCKPYKGKKTHFVVMGNVFVPEKEISVRYDLKGSTVGRQVKAKEREQNEYVVLKDLDLNHKIHFGPERRAMWFAQLESDTNFLREQNIMDYSLLLGIHQIPDEAPGRLMRRRTLSVINPSKSGQARLSLSDIAKTPLPGVSPRTNELQAQKRERTVSQFQADDGGFRGTDEANEPNNEIYYMGIIDILQPYNARKALEHSFKSLTWDPNGISAVEPHAYAKRFLNFLRVNTAGSDDAEGDGPIDPKGKKNVKS